MNENTWSKEDWLATASLEQKIAFLRDYADSPKDPRKRSFVYTSEIQNRHGIRYSGGYARDWNVASALCFNILGKDLMGYGRADPAYYNMMAIFLAELWGIDLWKSQD